MDGKIFFRSSVTPPPGTDFAFDLQRFDDQTITWKIGSSGTETTGTFSGFKTAAESANDIIFLSSDLTLESDLQLKRSISINASDVTLDLGTHKLNISTDDTAYNTGSKVNTFSGIVINDGRTLTVEGSTTGEINYTTSQIDSTQAQTGTYIKDTIKSLREIAAIKVGDSTAVNGTSAGLVVNGGTIKSNSTAICAGNGTTVSITGGTVESTYSTGIYVGNKNGRSNQTTDNITLNISGGTVKSAATSNLPAIQVSGTLATNTTTINITGGKVEYANQSTVFNDSGKAYGNPDAIYAGGNVDLNISAGEVTSGGTGIELRAGSLEVTGGTITSTATDYKVNQNSSDTSGGQTYGAAIAIAQHATNKDVTTTVSAGEVKGQVALAVENPIDSTSNSTISATITGGTFESTGTGTSAISAKASDSRSKININGTVTFKGKVESTVATTGTSGATPTITFGENAEVTVITTKTVVDEDGNVVTKEVTETYDTKSITFSETWKDSSNNDVTETYPVNDKTWNASHQAPTEKFFYLMVNNDESKVAGAKATLAPKTGSTGTLELTTSDFSGESLDVALSDLNSVGLDSKFKTLDATNGELNVGFNITSNDVITAITSGKGNDTLTAGAAGVSLNGGEGDDLLTGGDGADTFIFTAGKDTIAGYDKEDDLVSIGAGLTPPIDFANVSFDGSDFAISLGSDGANVLTFQSTEAFSITNGTGTYSYAGNKNGIESIAKEGDGISLGAGFTSKNYNGTELNYQTIDARKVTGSLTIRGNDATPGSSLFGAIGGGAVYGGMNNDSLQSNATTDSIGTILDGGDGNDLLIGSTGKDTFVYSAGADSIQGYKDGYLVNIKQLNIADAIYSVGTVGESTNISLNFGNGDNLTFENINNGAVSVKASGGNYVYTKDYYSHNGNSVFLAAGLSGTFNGGADSITSEYVTINAAAAGVISIVGNDKNNNIVGSDNATEGTLYGGKGNDKLDVTERANGAKFVFQYTEGKDTVDGFVADDKLDIDDTLVSSISKAKSSKGGTKLEFTFGKSKVLTFKGDEEFASVSLQDDTGFLTKDGVVTFASASDNTTTDTEEEKSSNDTGTQTDTEGTSDDTQTDTAAATTASLKLFASARGKIDLTEAPYASAGIASVNATAVKKQSVTMIGGADGGTFTFADKNKKKDQFNYGGGDVTIQGYESGVDKLELGTASLSGFKVTNNNSDVSLNADGKTISLVGAAGSEVMLHHAGSTRSSFTKMVFAADNVILNKSKRPTMATVSGSYDATNDSTVKKIFATSDIAAKSSIKAGDKAKTTIDASAAGDAVSLIGGAKNDKLIGSTSSLVADTFIYTGGKDIIENYNYSGDSGDKISISDFDSSLTSAKISAGKRSIKFKFGSKDALTIKPSKGASLGGSLNIDGVNSGYTYSKNAIASGSKASLTSQFSGSYKLKDKGITNVDGSIVEKNLTFKGTSAAETLSGGTKKTTFKGGGGADSFTGGTGKDIFFYAKGDKGDATIANFDVSSDKVKIASGTITKISSDDGKITFDMNSGRKGSANVGSFTINNLIGGYDSNGTLAAGTQTLIKANNTYLWFADKSGTDVSGNSFAQGALITSDKKISKSAVGSDCAVIDLGYSTNLVKAGVAYKVSGATLPSGTQNQESNG